MSEEPDITVKTVQLYLRW